MYLGKYTRVNGIFGGEGGGGIDEKEGRNRRLAQYIVNIEFTQTIVIYLINTSQ